MKIKAIGDKKTIISNPDSKYNYSAWPTVAKLQDGRIMVAASGMRTAHVDPFGKVVAVFSDDEGESYTYPSILIDTPLDDRDAGLCTFGEKGLILTTFNEPSSLQKVYHADKEDLPQKFRDLRAFYRGAINLITEEEDEKYKGSLFKISNDCGKTFGELHKSLVSSPHGPVELKDGRIFWLGNEYDSIFNYGSEKVMLCEIKKDGSCHHISTLPEIHHEDDGRRLNCYEPYLFEANDGTLLAFIRIESDLFTTFLLRSYDRGKTWDTPERLLPDRGGAPMHVMRHSSGVLIGVYTYREKPESIRAMFSYDDGKRWDTGYTVCINGFDSDMGYPSTVELSDGTLLTVFYEKEKEGGPAVIRQQKWSFEK